MADTVRTKTDILTNLFQDGQPAGSITEQDMRDFVVSVSAPHGRCSLSSASATTIAIAGTYYKAAGTTTLSGFESDFDDDTGTSNRLRYTGAATKHLHVAISISLTAGANNQVIGFKAYKYDDSAGTGAVQDDSVVRLKVSTGSDVQSTALHADFMVDQNDYLELWVTNETSTAAVTVQNLYMFALGMFE